MSVRTDGSKSQWKLPGVLHRFIQREKAGGLGNFRTNENVANDSIQFTFAIKLTPNRHLI